MRLVLGQGRTCYTAHCALQQPDGRQSLHSLAHPVSLLRAYAPRPV
ncbi:hypothetical protein DP44_5302 [Burkholderia pseudomallei]|nr:hypothetical protein DP44_5302 [Burkholderia pseudomallei]